MRIFICLVLTSLFYLNSYSQSKIIFAESKGKFDTGSTPDLFIYDVNTKKTDLLYKGVVGGRGEYSAAISPDNSRIIINTYQFGGWKLGIADYRNNKIGVLKKLTSRSTYEYNASWSRDGALIAYQDFNWGTRDTEIFIVDKYGGNAKQFTKSEGGDRSPCWTINNESLIYTSGRGNDYEIYIQALNSQKAINITSNSSNDFAPSTSRKEEKIAFLSDRMGTINLYTMNYDGSELKNITVDLKTDKINFNDFENSGYWAYRTSWSNDGNYIVFNLMINSNLEIFTIKKDGSELVQITNNQNSSFCPSWID